VDPQVDEVHGLQFACLACGHIANFEDVIEDVCGGEYESENLITTKLGS